MQEELLNSNQSKVQKQLETQEQKEKFQERVLLFMSIQFMLAGALNMHLDTVVTFEPTEGQYPCKYDDEGEAVIMPFKDCLQQEFCSMDYKYEPIYRFGQMTREFDFSCSHYFIPIFITTMYYLGGCVGAIYYGEQQQKRQERYKVMLETLILTGLASCATAFVPTAYLLFIVYFFCNFFLVGFFNTGIINFFEMSTKKMQILGPPLLMVAFGLGEILIPLFDQSLNWRNILFLIIGVPLLCSVILTNVIKESLQFLLSKGAEQPFNLELTPSKQLQTNLLQKIEGQITNSQPPQRFPHNIVSKYQVLFYQPQTKLNLAIFALYLFTFTFLQEITRIEIVKYSVVSIQDTFLFTEFSEALGYILSAYSALYFERKLTLSISFMLLAAFSAILVLLPSLSMILGTARIVSSLGFSLTILYILESFTTDLRHYAFAFLIAFSQFIFIFFQLFSYTFNTLGFGSFAVSFVLLLLCWLVVKYLNETFVEVEEDPAVVKIQVEEIEVQERAQ